MADPSPLALSGVTVIAIEQGRGGALAALIAEADVLVQNARLGVSYVR
ncbi:MAG TPA: hypothetical protein VGL34_16470 [Steroidobacteraceae bacterium]|jgi:hypothetical protein